MALGIAFRALYQSVWRHEVRPPRIQNGTSAPDPMHPTLFTLGYEGLTIADYSTCHRTYVARAARQFGGPSITHLTAKTALPDLGFQQAA